jgi:transposase
VAALQEQLKALDRQIAALTKAPQLHAVQELQKVPGIGPVKDWTLGGWPWRGWPWMVR